jgi:hypothetical protein
MVRRSPGRPAGLFLLERFQVLSDGVEPDFSPVLVGFDLMEDWSQMGISLLPWAAWVGCFPWMISLTFW